MRKSLNALAITAAAAISGQAHAQTTSIEVGVAPASMQHVYQAVADAFMEEHPDIKVNLRVASSYPELTQQILRDAITGETLDVSHQAYSQLRVLVDRELAVPLDQFMDAGDEEAMSSNRDLINAVGQVEGSLYGMPFWTSSPVVYYNLDLLEQAGHDPNRLPATWPEIIEAGKDVQALGNNTSGFYYIYENTDWPFQTLVKSFGGQIMSPDDSTIAFDDEAGLQAMELLKTFGESGMTEMTRDQARQAFVAGKLGILVDASSRLGGIEEGVADRFEIGVAVHPVEEPDGRLPVGGNAMMMLASDPAGQQAAWDYIEFASGPVGQTVMVKQTGALPISLEATKEEELLGAFYEDRPNQRALLEAVPILSSWYGFPGPNSNKIAAVIEEAAAQVARLEKEPQAALEDLTEQVRMLLP